MGMVRFSIYKYVKIEGKVKPWSYKKAVAGANGKLKPNVVLVDGKEETHPEGYYVLSIKGQRERAGLTSLEAQTEQRKRLAKQRYQKEAGEIIPEEVTGTLLADAADQYFMNLESQGKDPKTIRAYRAAVDGFVATCKKPVEKIGKQDLFDYMGWLRRQPIPVRKHGNPDRTMFNKVGHVAIFLKSIGKGGLLKKSEYPQYEEKLIAAHTDSELNFLYSRADDDQRFLLDFALGTGL